MILFHEMNANGIPPQSPAPDEVTDPLAHPSGNPLSSPVIGPFTRWGIRLLAIALVGWGIGIFVSTFRYWARWQASGDVLEALATVTEWTPEGMLTAIRAVAGIFIVNASLIFLIAWGAWRRRAGAWLALVAIGTLGLLQPAWVCLLWGHDAVRIHGWIGWAPVMGLWIGIIAFLLRGNTRRYFSRPPGARWGMGWLIVVGWLALMAALTPASILGLKAYLYRTHDVPFWRAGAPVQELEPVALTEGMAGHQVGNLYGFSFGIPEGARLINVPSAEDRDWGMVALGTLAENGRRAVIVSPETMDDLVPPSVFDQLGVDDPIGFGRAVLTNNWSLLPLVFYSISGKPEAGFIARDDEREAIAIVRPGRSEDQFFMEIVVRFPGRGAWSVVYFPIARDADWAEFAAGTIAMMQWDEELEVFDRVDLPPDGAGDLALLRHYWAGDLQAGIGLARRLIDRPEPRVPPAQRIVGEILDREPGHDGALFLRETLMELKSDHQPQPN